MEKRTLLPLALIFIILSICSTSCRQRSDYADIPGDSATVTKGREAFAQNCSACHNFRQDGIGPNLAGVTQEVSADWLKTFIKNPMAVVDAGDERGQKLLARYKTVMPAFPELDDEALTAIVAYLRTEKPAANTSGTVTAREELVDPLPGNIESSDLVVELEYIAQIPASGKGQFQTRITKLDFIPGTDRLFIVDIRGKLYELRNGVPEVYMDIADLKPDFIDAPGLATGFGSFAFHPEFLDNGLLYTGHTEKPRKVKADFHYADSIPAVVQWVVTEWKVDDPNGFPMRGTSRVLFRIDMVSGIHGMQELTFNPNSQPGDDDYGLLYIGIGDGGCVENGYPFLVHDITKPWGSIFRIDPQGRNSTNGNYGIPATNPFVGASPDALGEIYAYGFRNPHRITWTQSGLMLASNIGQAKIEAINLIRPGHNYGWPIREGTFLVDPYGDINKVYPLPEDDNEAGITYPVAQYDHDDGAAVSGGFEYTGSEIPELRDKYLFADMNNGRLYFINIPDIKDGRILPIREWYVRYDGKTVTTRELHGSKRVDLRLGKDHKGDVYLFSKHDGKVYRLARVVSKGTVL